MIKVAKALGVILVLAGIVFAMMDSNDLTIFMRSKEYAVAAMLIGTAITSIACRVETQIKENKRNLRYGKEEEIYGTERKAGNE